MQVNISIFIGRRIKYIYWRKMQIEMPIYQKHRKKKKMIFQMHVRCHRLKRSRSFPTENRLEPHEVIITPPPEEPRLSQASEGSEAASEAPSEASSPSGKTRRYRGDTSKRRKGVYITQWPESLDTDRNKLSAQSSEERDEPPATPSDLSDCEGHTPRR